jgi:PAS domain-containing protein
LPARDGGDGEPGDLPARWRSGRGVVRFESALDARRCVGEPGTRSGHRGVRDQGRRQRHLLPAHHGGDRSQAEIVVGLNPLKTPAGAFVLSSIVDISERKLADQALADSERRYRTLAEDLEIQVRERTRDLEKRNAEIQAQSGQLHDLSVQLLLSQDEERNDLNCERKW